MLEFDTKVKKWGNSVGLIIPKEKLDGIRENDEIHVLITRRNNVLKQTFGTIPEWKGKAQEMKDRLRRELYND